MLQTYVDVSALLKAYVNDAGSDAFVAWMETEQQQLCISPLSILDMQGAVAKCGRVGLISKGHSVSAFAAFEADRRAARYRELDWPTPVFETALDLLERINPIPLRSRDALHLAVARHFRCTAFATADRVQGEAAHRLGFAVYPFFT